MRIPQLMLGLIVAIAALLAVALWIGEPPGAGPVPHPEHPTLLRAGPAAAPTAAVLWLGWAFGALQIGFFGACFALGLRRREGLGPLRTPILAGLVAYEAVWSAFVWGYARFAEDPTAPLVFSFPLPTAIMLYGLWPLPLYFMWIYLRHFESWVLSEADLRRFRERLARLAAERETD